MQSCKVAPRQQLLAPQSRPARSRALPARTRSAPAAAPARAAPPAARRVLHSQPGLCFRLCCARLGSGCAGLHLRRHAGALRPARHVSKQVVRAGVAAQQLPRRREASAARRAALRLGVVRRRRQRRATRRGGGFLLRRHALQRAQKRRVRRSSAPCLVGGGAAGGLVRAAAVHHRGRSTARGREERGANARAVGHRPRPPSTQAPKPAPQTETRARKAGRLKEAECKPAVQSGAVAQRRGQRSFASGRRRLTLSRWRAAARARQPLRG